MSLRDQMATIYSTHGLLTPALVVDVARPAEHPLHSRFDWDDATAGESWRRQQARELIRSVRLTYREATDTQPAKTIRAYNAVETPEGHVYKPAEEVAADPLLAQMVRRDMERAWRDLKRRYADFEEFWRMVAADADESAA
jgi:hypothetical protein